jgi:hypothetical protein
VPQTSLNEGWASVILRARLDSGEERKKIFRMESAENGRALLSVVLEVRPDLLQGEKPII